MVIFLKKYFYLLFLLAGASKTCLALLPQTQQDLLRLEDELAERTKDIESSLFPVLLASPTAYYQESKDDFASAVLKTLNQTFRNRHSQIIACPECQGTHTHLKPNQWLLLRNGPLSTEELQQVIQANKKYQKAQSVLFIKESPSGVIAQWISLADGRLVVHAIADSNQDLDSVNPSMHFAKEYRRRLRGEPITHMSLQFGVYPTGSFLMQFLEQWGAYNQHISGLELSLFNPEISLGPGYYFVLPKIKGLPLGNQQKIAAGASVLFSLKNMLNTDDSNASLEYTFRVSATYAYSKTYGFFASMQSSTGGAGGDSMTIGIAMYNPILLPFIL